MTQPQQAPMTGKQKLAEKLAGYLTEYGHHCHTRERMQRELKSLELVIETISGKIAGLREGLPLLPDKEVEAKQPYPIKMPEQPEVAPPPQVAKKGTGGPVFDGATPPPDHKDTLPSAAAHHPVGTKAELPKRGRGRPAKKQSVTKALKDLGEASAQVGEIRARAS